MLRDRGVSRAAVAGSGGHTIVSLVNAMPPLLHERPSRLRLALSLGAVVAVAVLTLLWDGPPLLAWTEVPQLGQILALTFASALLSALMSNTATVTMLIPLAANLDPNPSTAVLIAIAASLGAPFVISTPPNAMVYGEGV